MQAKMLLKIVCDIASNFGVKFSKAYYYSAMIESNDLEIGGKQKINALTLFEIIYFKN
jgi:hypothetical protein